MGIFGIERIDEEGVTPLDRPASRHRIEVRLMEHFRGNPPAAHPPREGFRGVNHTRTLQYKVLIVKRGAG